MIIQLAAVTHTHTVNKKETDGLIAHQALEDIRRTVNNKTYFIHLDVIVCQICEIPRNFKLIATFAVQSNPRSSTLVPTETT